jgi:hypothetical protein
MSESVSPTGIRLNFSSILPLGRPKCDMSTIDEPESRHSLIDGITDWIRNESTTRSFSIGTLKSTRISTRFCFTSKECNALIITKIFPWGCACDA